MSFLAAIFHIISYKHLLCGDDMKNIRLVQRDYIIFNEIFRWKIITGKHICNLTGFTGQRACNQRLYKLKNAGFITRQKVLYGFPGIYKLTSKAKKLIAVPNYKEQIRLEQVFHDSKVLDTAIYFHHKYHIPFSDIATEKQLHSKDGFSNRKHRPDFIFSLDRKTNCVEVELTPKSKQRLEKNVLENFQNYHLQYWIIPDFKTKIYTNLSELQRGYPNIEIIELGEIN